MPLGSDSPQAALAEGGFVAGMSQVLLLYRATCTLRACSRTGLAGCTRPNLQTWLRDPPRDEQDHGFLQDR
jgi:hypothetical protein